ncbi:MAG: YdeI/OmpD-associated family protein [Chitinophagaceae bacterium]|nr:YdeI/OmpD-associated family protein [Chitinophagaceae bacterium]
MQQKDIETYCPVSRQDWRQWLKENHGLKQSVWLVCYKKKYNIPTIIWSEAVEEALCFGWIDSRRISLGDDRFMQFFCKRKVKSVWSKINKGKVQQLIDKGLMTTAGYESIKAAKLNGSWTILDNVEKLKVPGDLAKEFKRRPGSKDYFMGLSKSVRKSILQWLVLAKRPETRQKRVDEIAELASRMLKPKQFR